MDENQSSIEQKIVFPGSQPTSYTNQSTLSNIENAVGSQMTSYSLVTQETSPTESQAIVMDTVDGFN